MDAVQLPTTTKTAVRLHRIGSRLVIGSSTSALGNRPRSVFVRQAPELKMGFAETWCDDCCSLPRPASLLPEKQPVCETCSTIPHRTCVVSHTLDWTREKAELDELPSGKLHGGAGCLACHGHDLQGPSCPAESAPLVMKLPLRAVRSSV
jgi:hypothetical protein